MPGGIILIPLKAGPTENIYKTKQRRKTMSHCQCETKLKSWFHIPRTPSFIFRYHKIKIKKTTTTTRQQLDNTKKEKGYRGT